MAELDSLIGCKISLISHQDIRYDGTLFSINQAASSIVLKDVKAFGTEDRITDKSKTIPASSQTIPFVTFPGQEIKDLYVHESQNPPSPAPAAPVVAAAAPTPVVAPAPAPAPAPVTEQKPKHDSKPKQHHAKTESVAPPAPPAHVEVKPVVQQPIVAPAPVVSNPIVNNNKEIPSNNNKSAHSGVGTGSHLLKLRERKTGEGSNAKVDSNSEFNFEEGLKGFNKDEVLAGVSDNNSKKYVKDDFFDDFSGGDVDDAGKKTRMTASEERQLNQDTFGAIALTSMYRRGGRGRGGRGGGRSGGRSNGRGSGRGRGGGYTNNTNASGNK